MIIGKDMQSSNNRHELNEPDLLKFKMGLARVCALEYRTQRLFKGDGKKDTTVMMQILQSDFSGELL